MADLFDTRDGEHQIIPARKLTARVAGLYAANGQDFESAAVESLELGFGGITGDMHAGLTRRSGGREPWYARGTEMRNERQVSLVCPAELKAIAARMELSGVRPEWIGANMLIEGIPGLSMLPPRTLLFFASGATIRIDGQNAPCRQAGKRLARRAGMADMAAGALRFSKVAGRLRGLVGWVEKPGTVSCGEAVTVRVPEHWLYR